LEFEEWVREGECGVNHLQHTKQVFNNIADSQEEKGIAKYGKPLDPLDDYNWLSMAREELVDGFKYLEAEQVKRNFICNRIRKLLDYRDNSVSKTEILHWLDVLEGNNKTPRQYKR